MNSIITQIHSLAKMSDEVGRLEIQKALRNLQIELHSPKDLLLSLANSVSGFDTHFLPSILLTCLATPCWNHPDGS